VHIGARLPHRLDNLVKRNAMHSIARESQVCRINSLHGAKGVALNTWDLNQAPHRIAGHSKMVLDRYFRRILDLPISPA
jgi:hypothetical protein